MLRVSTVSVFQVKQLLDKHQVTRQNIETALVIRSRFEGSPLTADFMNRFIEYYDLVHPILMFSNNESQIFLMDSGTLLTKRTATSSVLKLRPQKVLRSRF